MATEKIEIDELWLIILAFGLFWLNLDNPFIPKARSRDWPSLTSPSAAVTIVIVD
jgi:hypothetical protein